MMKWFLISLSIGFFQITNCSTIKVNIAEKKKQIQEIHKVAIIPFEIKGNPEMGLDFANAFSIFLIQNHRIEIVERNRKELDKILQEQKFSRTGIIDQETAAEMGKILGVDAILIGEAESDKANSKDIIKNFKIKLINVENGVIVIGAIKEPGIEWTIPTLLKYIFGFGYIWNKEELLAHTSSSNFIADITSKKMLDSISSVESKPLFPPFQKEKEETPK